jgi:predicted secreted Zn-dependent protease
MSEGRAAHSDLIWRRSLSCNSGACVEVAASGQTILIADSKAPSGPVLSYTAAEFREFITGAKNGDFDDLIQ